MTLKKLVSLNPIQYEQKDYKHLLHNYVRYLDLFLAEVINREKFPVDWQDHRDNIESQYPKSFKEWLNTEI